MEGTIRAAPTPGTSYYGETFEHFIILEFYRLNQYLEADYRLSYLTTKEGAEIDLVLSRGNKVILIEIKSSEQIDEIEVRKLARFGEGLSTELYYLCRSSHPQIISNVKCYPWELGLREIFGLAEN